MRIAKPFPYKGKNLGKRELVFMIHVIIASAVDSLYCAIYDPSFKANEKASSEWESAVLDMVGWNLSILFAQTNSAGEGMGVGDALSIADLHEEIPVCARNWGNEKMIVNLSNKWFDEVFNSGT